jgi:hypothetical protein
MGIRVVVVELAAIFWFLPGPCPGVAGALGFLALGAVLPGLGSLPAQAGQDQGDVESRSTPCAKRCASPPCRHPRPGRDAGQEAAT